MSEGSGAGLEPPPLESPPRRIVSLVPSLTEMLFALGLGERVVGVTEWCVHPREGVAGLPKLGGTKNPDVPGILALSPDLVIANREENTRRAVEALRAGGAPVWVTYPRTVREGAALFAAVAGLGAEPDRADAALAPVWRALERAEQATPARRPRVACPIWKEPWMMVGGDTYSHDLIELCGGENVFAEVGDRRYPRVRTEDLVASEPEVLLLPDEPYAFGEKDAQELRELAIPAAREGRIHVIDGTLLSWYGPRIARAVTTLRRLLHGVS